MIKFKFFKFLHEELGIEQAFSQMLSARFQYGRYLK